MPSGRMDPAVKAALEGFLTQQLEPPAAQRRRVA
jgi:hypothetical protein